MNSRKAKGLHPTREPNGRLSRSTADEIDAVSPAAAKRLFDDAIRGRAAPEFGTQLARLFMDRKISAPQYEAGRRWARLGVEYRLAIAAPHPWEKPGTLGTVGMINGYGLGDDPAVTSPEGRRLREKRWRYISEMEGALAALGAAGALLQALRHTVEQDNRVEEAVTVLENALGRERATISTLRDLSFALEPVVLRDQGFGAAVTALADQLAAATGIPVKLSLEPAEALGEKAQVALYQTIREALDQAVRRRPARISIAVDRDPDGGFRTVIADDGVRERRRATADAIAERVRILGGRVAIEATEGGTSVCVTLPGYVASV